MPLRWRSDLSKLVLKANFDRRGWVETEDDHPSGEEAQRPYQQPPSSSWSVPMWLHSRPLPHPRPSLQQPVPPVPLLPAIMPDPSHPTPSPLLSSAPPRPALPRPLTNSLGSILGQHGLAAGPVWRGRLCEAAPRPARQPLPQPARAHTQGGWVWGKGAGGRGRGGAAAAALQPCPKPARAHMQGEEVVCVGGGGGG
jgi:hypothetical protein